MFDGDLPWYEIHEKVASNVVSGSFDLSHQLAAFNFNTGLINSSSVNVLSDWLSDQRIWLPATWSRILHLLMYYLIGWGISVSDYQPLGRGFDSRHFHRIIFLVDLFGTWSRGPLGAACWDVAGLISKVDLWSVGSRFWWLKNRKEGP